MSSKSDVNAYLDALPTWKDDNVMAAMMAMFKRRDVNPHDYDARMKFWSRLISDTCAKSRSPLFNYRTLLTRFTRDDRVPAGLTVVLQHLIDTGVIQSLNTFRAGGESWLQWGVNMLVKRPVGWLAGWNSSSSSSSNEGGVGANDDIRQDEFVHIDVMQAADLLTRHTRAQQLGDVTDPLASSLLSYADLQRSTSDMFADETALDLALLSLQRQGHLTISDPPMGRNTHTARMERLIKFADGGDTGRVQVTEIDTNLINMRRALEKLNREIELLETKVKTLENEARKLLGAGNKTRALQTLRQKKLLEKKIDEKDKVYTNLAELLNKVEQTADQRQVVDAYKAGVQAFKQTLRKNGLSASDIDETMEEIHESMSDHNDITMALAAGPSGDASSTVGNDELERELNDLLASDSGAAAAVPAEYEPRAKEPRYTFEHNLPAVPTHAPGEFIRPTAAAVQSSQVKKLTLGEKTSTPGTRDRIAELRQQLTNS